jgi:ABC-type xylose transport system permease subunit
LYGEIQMASTTFSGPVTSTNGFIGTTTGNVVGDVTGVVTGSLVGFATLPTYTVTSANALATKPAGKIIYVSNGLAGNPCIAVGNGTNWISPAGTAIAAS